MRAGTKGDLSSETLGLYHQRLVSTWEIKLMSNILFRTMRVHIQNSWILISLPYVVCFGTNEQKKWHLFHKDHVFKEQNWIWYFFLFFRGNKYIGSSSLFQLPFCNQQDTLFTQFSIFVSSTKWSPNDYWFIKYGVAY